MQKDYETALELLQAAADQGMAEAMFEVGRCYENGKGVEQDYEKAVEYYRIAADMGIQEAEDALKKLVKEGKIEEIPDTHNE